jgi:hypothetical protein
MRSRYRPRCHSTDAYTHPMNTPTAPTYTPRRIHSPCPSPRSSPASRSSPRSSPKYSEYSIVSTVGVQYIFSSFITSRCHDSFAQLLLKFALNCGF